MPMFLVIFKPTLVDFAIIFLENAESILFSVVKFTLIFVTILPLHNSLPAVFVIQEVSDVDIPSRVSFGPMTLNLTLFKITNVFGTIIHFIHPSPME